MKSTRLRNKGILAILSILLFCFSYILLLLFAVGLATLCCYAGILVFFKMGISFLSLIIGISLIFIGLLVLIFLLRYSFQRKKTDLSGMIEIHRTDQPQLFEFIGTIAQKSQNKFPKKIYITDNVNACVFYNSAFLSMFFPNRKNLCIGLGLVNSLTKSEFEAILAHEFGHFSQKSMKVGSYVYNVNQIIYNLVYNNSHYPLLQTWANIHFIFALSARIGAGIIQGIQWILRKLYNVVNLNYMGLSREMEFHADSIAASLTSPESLIRGLLVTSFSDSVYQDTLAFNGDWIKQNKKAGNIYPQHAYAINFWANKYKMEVVNGLPVMDEETALRLNKNKSRITIKDQWASHPTMEDRISRLKEANKTTFTPLTQPAWDYFKNKTGLQEELTNLLYKSVHFNQDPQIITLDEFKEKYSHAKNKYSFDPLYKEFYDNHPIKKLDINTVDSGQINPETTITDIFKDENIDLLYKEKGINDDLYVLGLIDSGSIEIHSFDFEGKKYRAKYAYDLSLKLKKEKEEIEASVHSIDCTAFLYFYSLAKSKEEEAQLQSSYNVYFITEEEHTKNIGLYNEMIEATQFIKEYNQLETIEQNMRTVKHKETDLKNKLSSLVKHEKIDQLIDPERKAVIEKYLSTDWQYFTGSTYNYEGLDSLFGGIQALLTLSEDIRFTVKKELLDFQIKLLKNGEGRIESGK